MQKVQKFMEAKKFFGYSFLYLNEGTNKGDENFSKKRSSLVFEVIVQTAKHTF